MNDYQDAFTFADLDRHLGLAKGQAFRAFKALNTGFIEGKDYWVLHAPQHTKTIEQLKAEGRLYPSSVQAVFISPLFARKICALCAGHASVVPLPNR